MFLQGGKAFHGWETVKISKNLDNLAHSFSMEVHDKFQGSSNFPLKPGLKSEIFIEEGRVATGWIEKLDMSFAPGSRKITISGRSLPGDLVDSSHTGDMEYNGLALDKLAEKLVEPFGLKVFLSVSPTFWYISMRNSLWEAATTA